MSNDFPQGVEYYTVMTREITVNFPNGRVKCRYCPFCYAEKELNRYRCRLHNRLVFTPDEDGIPEWCEFDFLDVKECSEYGNTGIDTR